MADVVKFNIDNTDINIKDETARTNAGTALNNSNTAMQNASTALNKVIALEQLTRIDITYTSVNETITITREDHSPEEV